MAYRELKNVSNRVRFAILSNLICNSLEYDLHFSRIWFAFSLELSKIKIFQFLWVGGNDISSNHLKILAILNQLMKERIAKAVILMSQLINFLLVMIYISLEYDLHFSRIWFTFLSNMISPLSILPLYWESTVHNFLTIIKFKIFPHSLSMHCRV